MIMTTTPPLWTPDALIMASGAACDGEITSAITGFSIDTRSLRAGDVFVALTDQRDGHEFVEAAFNAGAAAALVRRDYARCPSDGCLLRVDDPLRALERIGRAARARLADDAKVIAVTGSAGKTTTKEMLRACFEAVAPGHVHAAVKSFNNHWGVPLTLANMPEDTAFGVFEIGMNHAGEITPLTEMVRPHVALVTSVLPVHVGNFDDGIDGVAHAKAEIFAGLTPKAGFAILPRDTTHFEVLRDRATAALGIAPSDWSEDFGVFTFGEHADADQGVDVEHSEFRADGSEVAFRFGKGATVPVISDIQVPGRHNASNAAGAIAAWFAATTHRDMPTTPGEAFPGLGATLDALADLKIAPEGRGQVHQLADEITLIDESYNANPASVAAALATLSLYPVDRRRIAVLGDMLELGAGAEAMHTGLVTALQDASVAKLYCCGPHMKALFDCIPVQMRGAWAETSVSLEHRMLDGIGPGDVVVIKGSLGSRMQPLTAALKARYLSSGGD